MQLTLAAAAGVALTVLALLAAGHAGTLRLGPLKVTINNYVNPLLLGAVSLSAFLVVGWRRRRWRVFAAAGFAILGALAVIAFSRASAPITTASDLALVELYTALAADGRLLLGPYSRYGWHHPGPLYFYVQAPLYAMSGDRAAALYAGALLLNLAAGATLIWIVARERVRTATILASACALYAWRLPQFLASPWTAHVTILPALAALAACAGVMAGRAWMLPVAVLWGSLAVQTRVALVPLAAVAALCVGVHLLRRWRAGQPVRSGALHASAWLAVVLWLPVLSEAVSGQGGNVAALWPFFVIEPSSGLPVSEAFTQWTYALSAVLRPDFELPWGSRVELGARWRAMLCALAQVALLPPVLAWHVRERRRFEAAFAGLALGASLAGLGAVLQIREEVRNHEVFWLSAVGLVNLAVIADAGLARLREGGRVSATASTACAIVGASTLVVGIIHLRDITGFEQRRPERAVTVAAHQSLRSHLQYGGVVRPLIVLGDGVWSESVGVLLRLYLEGVDFAVDESSGSMFGVLPGPTGREDAIVHITRGGDHERLKEPPGNIVLFEDHPLFVNVVRTGR